jgi:hypothetical protein
MFTSVISGAVAFAKAVPIINDWVQQFVQMWITYGIDKIEETANEWEAKRDSQLKAISKAETNAERKALSITLNDIINRRKV